MEFTTTEITAIAIAAGALINSFVSAKSAKTNALKTVEEVYGAIVKSLRDEVTALSEKVKELEGRRCDNIGCKNRMPPIK